MYPSKEIIFVSWKFAPGRTKITLFTHQAASPQEDNILNENEIVLTVFTKNRLTQESKPSKIYRETWYREQNIHLNS